MRCVNLLAAIVIVAGFGWCETAAGRMSESDLEELRAAGEREGWTFSVGRSPASEYTIEELCGLDAGQAWRADGAAAADLPDIDLPTAFDLRYLCTPVKSQGGCGSCWAFATVGTLECAVMIKEDVTVDLSEQWLISCNTETDPPHLLGDGSWGCAGGWFAHQYHQGKPDACGGFGAVTESAFPYTATDVPCGCPYDHTDMLIDSWGYVGGEEEIPNRESIKRAIMTYGPVTAAVVADSPFRAYTDGVFNAHNPGEVNHAIVLVGWDDTVGTEGAWILRNSWGPNWALDGYMYIEYECSNVGFAACYIDYPRVNPVLGPVLTKQIGNRVAVEGGSVTLSVEASGLGAIRYKWTRNGVTLDEQSGTLTLAPIESEDGGRYICYVSDLRGTTVSETANIMVLGPAHSVPASNTATVLLTIYAIACLAYIGMRTGEYRSDDI